MTFYLYLRFYVLQISKNKLVPPSTAVVYLGKLIDTMKKTVSIPQDMVSEIQNTSITWGNKTECTKTQLQALLGNLGEKPYRENPYRRKTLHFWMAVEKSPKPFWQTVEKSPTLISQTMKKSSTTLKIQ